jgi:superfamily II DNA or RNA helicase
MDITYDLELDENSPIKKQNELIKRQLKPHQLVCLQKAYIMEKTGEINYYIDGEKHNDIYNTCLKGDYSINTNIGIIGDIVGYGKTLTALSIISSCNLDDIYLNKEYNKSYISNTNYSYFSYSTHNKKIKNNDTMNHTTLVIVPRGPVYVQWEKTLKEDTNLKYIAINNLNFIKKNLPNEDDILKNSDILNNYFDNYDVVLIKNTTLDVLIKYYNDIYNTNNNINYNSIKKIYRWKRIMIDEAHDLIRFVPLLHYYQLWLISGTYEDMINSIRSPGSILFDIRNVFNDIKNIKLMLIKCNRNFIRSSFKLPVPEEKYYLCKMSLQFATIKDFITNSVIDKLNANDITGAIRELGGKAETEENMIELITKDINTDIENKKREIEYTKSLILQNDVKEQKIKKLENDLFILNDRLISLKNRISELENKSCAICMDFLVKPILLKCTHSYCGICIMNWIKNNKKCPECRTKIETDDMIAITNTIETNNSEKNLSKIDTLINIINSKKDGKFLVFSKYESGFYSIINKLKSSNISYGELKGNTSHMMNILNDFKKSKLKVILLNTLYAGSGIDISSATDVIIFHSLGLYKQQAVGRAQRVGRIDKLYIHNLCYEQEMPNN